MDNIANAWFFATKEDINTLRMELENTEKRLILCVDTQGKELSENTNSQGRELSVRIDAQEIKLNARIDAQSERITAIDTNLRQCMLSLETRVNARMDGIAQDLINSVTDDKNEMIKLFSGFIISIIAAIVAAAIGLAQYLSFFVDIIIKLNTSP